ncbi:beta-galactosidase [Gracilibacillus alcaliphilus]|uniref:beta-galactosidase n=1 Tax=Gracilibacillus alcaliphilus TaxID=1401441 RepID=UPI001958A4F5|nr:beta-galactosidase [Gracilibacillus alcaliphilus]MBM7675601.1 beta-galactosidase [Gracilibacillus alcaliphilus]
MKEIQHFLYGGDYNPNQWDRETWKEDMTYFKDARINSATVNVFSWAKIQPTEHQYDFSELDDIMDMLTKENYQIVLATSTAALPAWMFKKYPEVGRTDFEGRHHKFGQRHNACPNSLVYQKYAKRLASKLAERYGDNPQLAYWHINNEYGGECFCENCEKAFRIWLRDKYKTIEALNKAWNLEFWGHTVYEWDEIVLPNALSEGISYKDTAFAGISIDYRRFNSDSMLENFKMEREAIREWDKETPITTNLMGTYYYLDYFKWAKEMDIVSWDSYPAYNTPWSEVALRHDLMRGLKKQPFMLMEQTPSQQNWQPYNSLKKPGQLRAQSFQTIAHGANTIQYFQLRRSIGACEKFHGAVIAHSGTNNTRVFREVKQIGEELEAVGKELLATNIKSKVALIFDWDNYWALEYTSGPNKDLTYVEQIHHIYQYFYKQNISVDLVSLDDDLSDYQLVLAPVLYMIKEGTAEKIEKFVAEGGVLVTGFMSGIVDQSDNVHLGGYPGPLRQLCGVWVEEIDALAPEQRNQIAWTDGQQGEGKLVSDIIHLETAQELAQYASNFYQGTPAVTVNDYQAGKVYYFGTSLDDDSLAILLDKAAASAHIEKAAVDTKLEIVTREGNDVSFTFIINFTDESVPVPEAFTGKTDYLTNQTIDDQLELTPYDVLLIKE